MVDGGAVVVVGGVVVGSVGSVGSVVVDGDPPSLDAGSVHVPLPLPAAVAVGGALHVPAGAVPDADGDADVGAVVVADRGASAVRWARFRRVAWRRCSVDVSPPMSDRSCCSCTCSAATTAALGDGVEAAAVVTPVASPPTASAATARLLRGSGMG